MNEVFYILLLPLLAGLILFLLPDRYNIVKSISALLISIISGYLAIMLLKTANQTITLNQLLPEGMRSFLSDNDILNNYIVFCVDDLGKLILLVSNLLEVLILLYSIVFVKSETVRNYYSYFLITIGCANGAIISDNLLLFITFWGILGLTLYKLISGRDQESSAAAKKTLILVGASDSIMIIGVALIWRLSGSLGMHAPPLPVNNALAVAAFLAFICGSFTKAGAFPFHTWVPDYTKNAAATSSAFMPAALDKLLGIYFLARITGTIFTMNEWIKLLLLLAGTISIITAVLMALMQHDYKRLLGYHAVSQVGYMILGFGLGSAIGVAAGLFHMLNNVIYKSGLFLSAGCIEYRTGKNEIDELGGLSGGMPVTFICSLIFAMSISGIPPFNGFASKWMIYQGIIESGGGSGLAARLWPLWLGLAVIGSALTLASFIKLTGGIFLGRAKNEFRGIKEAPSLMLIPVVLLALICILLGIFATVFAVPEIIMPASGSFVMHGFWESSTVALMVLLSIIMGVVIYLLSRKRFRTEDSFIGGEKMYNEAEFPATGFYKTLTEFGMISRLYRRAEERWFDIYDLSSKSVLRISHLLSDLHSGVLTGYVMWVIAGLIIMLMVLI